MKNILKKFVSVSLCLVLIFALCSCSSNVEMTEENITETVQIVDTALKDFDTKKLKKYVDSQTLNVIMNFAEDHEQFAELGRKIFAGMEMNIDSIDTTAGTVTVTVTNKNLTAVASQFAGQLLSDYTKVQLLAQLKNESFLDSGLSTLTDGIANELAKTEATITLKVKQGKRNLVLSFDEDAENAVSGGALSAIKSLI